MGLQTLHDLWNLAYIDDLDPQFGVQTWFLNHRTGWRCNLARPYQLSIHIETWAQDLIHLWRDEYVPAMPLHFYLVFPQPYDMESGIRAHLILVQPEYFDLVPILITVYDNDLHPERARRFAVLHTLTLSLSELLQHADRAQVCQEPDVDCTAWCGWDRIDLHGPFPLQSGHGITLSIHRQGIVPPALHTQEALATDANPADGLGLLQLHHKVTSKVTLTLDNLIAPPSQDAPEFGPGIFHHLASSRQAIRLWNVNLPQDPPTFLDFPLGVTADMIQSELRLWGHRSTVYFLASRSTAFCFDHRPLDATHCIVYHHDDLLDHDGLLLEWVLDLPDELGHMQYLHRHGYLRGVVWRLPPLCTMSFW